MKSRLVGNIPTLVKQKLLVRSKDLEHWENKENVMQFLSELKGIYNLQKPEDWNLISKMQIQSNGGNTLLSKYSMYELKCMACPEGKSIFSKNHQPSGYWENKNNILQFLQRLKIKYHFHNPGDWNLLSTKQIQDNGGTTLLRKYSLYQLKCLACPEGKLTFNKPSSYWENKENIYEFLDVLKQKYNLQSIKDWNTISNKQIQSNGGNTLLTKYSIYELKCMACPEGKLIFDKQQKPPGYWESKENILQFLSELKEKYNLQTPEDWNSISHSQIQSNGGGSLLSKYSIYQLKCMACPEGKSIFNNQKRPSEYWENKDNILQFLNEIKDKYNLQTPEDWNSISKQQLISNGGSGLVRKYSIYDLKCMACPEGKLSFDSPNKPPGYWENKENVIDFLNEIKEKYNLNTPEDWNSITIAQIQDSGGKPLLRNYSIFDIKCLACPEGKSMFDKQPKPAGYWENKDNIMQFLSELKEKYNLQTPEDWNTITTAQIQSNGGSRLLSKYSIYELKCIACPEGKLFLDYPPKPSGYWENTENVIQYLNEIQQKFNFQTPEDWNSVTYKQINSLGGQGLLSKYSIYELKCMACPEGKSIFNNPYHPPGYWENKKNILQFLKEIKEINNFQTPEDWNSLTHKQIQSHGGGTLLVKYPIYELKCLACPEGKSLFDNPHKSQGYWENKENILQFLSELKEKYNLQTPEDWNSITHKHIQSLGGKALLGLCSIYELKSMACPEEKEIFNFKYKPADYWENETNRNHFFSQLKKKYHLHTPLDWKRISQHQILSQGGSWLLTGTHDYLNTPIEFHHPDKENKKYFVPLKDLISDLNYNFKRASQRWLFLQIQKLFPNEEIVEDYFHSEISRISGSNIQFDVYLMNRKIAIEYHGKQHYEDIPSGFSSLELYQTRDIEKKKLCQDHGIQLIVIPYWWDNKLDSLRETLRSEINL